MAENCQAAIHIKSRTQIKTIESISHNENAHHQKRSKVKEVFNPDEVFSGNPVLKITEKRYNSFTYLIGPPSWLQDHTVVPNHVVMKQS